MEMLVIKDVCYGRKPYFRASFLAIETGIASYRLWSLPLLRIIMWSTLIFGRATIRCRLTVGARLAALAK